MKQQTVSEILRILDQQISCEEIQNSLRTLQNNVDDSEAAFVFKCMHALSPSILPLECVDGLRSDKGLQSADCLAVWWFTLHLVCLFSPELYKRNYEQKKTQ